MLDQNLNAQTKIFRQLSIIRSPSTDPRGVSQIVDGWAARFTLDVDGRRQILAVLSSGDYVDTHALESGANMVGVVALTQVECRLTPLPQFRQILSEDTAARADWDLRLYRDANDLQNLAIVLGRQPGTVRIAYVANLLVSRASPSGTAENGNYDLPLSQTDLGDMACVTGVHTNRILRRELSSLIRWAKGKIVVLDANGLRRLATLPLKA